MKKTVITVLLAVTLLLNVTAVGATTLTKTTKAPFVHILIDPPTS